MVTINLPPLPIQRLDSFSTVADLRAYSSATLEDGLNVAVDGADSVGDGYGGVYTWSELSTLADNGVTIIRPNDVPPLTAGRWILIGGGIVQFRQSGADAVLRTLQDKSREILTPADFGVTADGVNTDAAFAKLVTYANSLPQGAAIILPAGDIALSNVYSFTKNVTLVGRGAGISRFVLGVNARLRFIGSRQGPFNRTFTLSDFSVLVTGGIHSSGPVYVDYIEQGTGEPSLSQTLQMRNMLIGGLTTADGFTNGLELVDCPWPKLDNVAFRGDNAYLSGKGIRYTGAHGSPSFIQVRGIYLQDFIWCSGEMEGYVFQDCECLSVQRGIYVADTTTGLQPLLNITSTHIDAEEYCIRIIGITQFSIDASVNLTATPAMGIATTWTGVDVTPTLAAGAADTVVCTGSIRPTISTDGAFASTTIGVRIRGTTQSIDLYNIGGEMTGPMTTGVQLDTNTNGVEVEENIVMVNVVTPVVNNGNNVIKGAGYIYTVANLPAANSFRLRGGMRLTISDASGGAAFNSTAVGGGATIAPVYYTGTEWRIG